MKVTCACGSGFQKTAFMDSISRVRYRPVAVGEVTARVQKMVLNVV